MELSKQNRTVGSRRRVRRNPVSDVCVCVCVCVCVRVSRTIFASRTRPVGCVDGQVQCGGTGRLFFNRNGMPLIRSAWLPWRRLFLGGGPRLPTGRRGPSEAACFAAGSSHGRGSGPGPAPPIATWATRQVAPIPTIHSHSLSRFP